MIDVHDAVEGGATPRRGGVGVKVHARVTAGGAQRGQPANPPDPLAATVAPRLGRDAATPRRVAETGARRSAAT
jgi:hypothetical protein